jgi:hypothetical protein
MTSWQRDGIHFLLGLTLALVFFGAVITVGGVLLLLLGAVMPSSLRHIVQGFSRPLEIGLLLIAVVEVIAWSLLPLVGFTSQKLGRRMQIGMAAMMLFLAVSLLFSL